MLDRRIVGAVLALGLGGCISREEMGAVQTAVAQFHERQANAQDDEIYRTASADFRRSAQVSDLSRLNNAVRAAQVCDPPARDPSYFNNNQSTSGHFVTVVYNRNCRDGEMVETFVFRMQGGQAVLQSYNVSGMALFPAAAAAPAAKPAATEKD